MLLAVKINSFIKFSLKAGLMTSFWTTFCHCGVGDSFKMDTWAILFLFAVYILNVPAPD